jgi:putative SOS response-associated peptidase YedK
MCGRYTLTSQAELVEELELKLGEPIEASEWWRPRFNIAPTQPAPVVTEREGERLIEMLRWGLVPPWAASLSEGAKLINARSEGIATRPAFRDAIKHRRCLVLADGFFEWRGDGKARIPIYLRPVPRRTVTFAGLWERWKGPDGAWVLTFTIITGPANELVAPYHDRMPVVVERADRAAWMADAVLPGLPAVADWQAGEVSRRVNSVTNDDPGCIEPEAASPPAQGRLF